MGRMVVGSRSRPASGSPSAAKQVAALSESHGPARTAAPSGLALALEAFGEAVGIAYQIRDDLDDDAEDERAATWSDDEASGRPTLVAAAGRGAAAARIEAHLARAGAALAPLAAAGVDPQLLMVLARRLLGEPVEGASPASPG